MSGFKFAAKQRTDSDGNCRCRYCLVLQHLQKAKFLTRQPFGVLPTGLSREESGQGAVISEFFSKKEVPDMYAIIATGGKQYKVSEGDVIDVEKIAAEAGAEVTFDNVLAIGGETLKVAGDVAGASVTGTVMEQGKARKVVVYRYKRKTG